MARIYRLSRAGLKIVYKIRHHRGHGIHSPFVFNLINKVIEEKNPYYAYGNIEEYIKNNNGKSSLQKFNRLSFRLVHYFDARTILEIGAGVGINTIAITAPSSDIVCDSVEQNTTRLDKATQLCSAWDRNIVLHRAMPTTSAKLDAIFLDLKYYDDVSDAEIEKLLSQVHNKTFIVVKGIRTNRRHRLLWKKMLLTEKRTAVLDLFNVGILFFDTKLYRWEYQISY